jgi:hypothetical protein
MSISHSFLIAATIGGFVIAHTVYGARTTQVPRASAPAVSVCDTIPAFHVLDFWIGDWDVFADGKLNGRDRVTRILDGCALTEEWTGVAGDNGMSLFIFDIRHGRWNQTWVTNNPTVPGGVKDKHLVALYPGGATRFQGVLGPRPNNTYLFDRTTLTPMPDSSVRQVIEISRDGGTTWEVNFDARYRRRR